jgi:hypothetical protein
MPQPNMSGNSSQPGYSHTNSTASCAATKNRANGQHTWMRHHQLPPGRHTWPDTERPIFVLAQSRDTHDRITIIPFARFDIPATPAEWTTGLAFTPLKVLCFWNSRQIPARHLENSWLAETLSAEHLKRVNDALPHSAMPCPSAPEFGPRLQHPLDPRHIYLHEEQTLLDDAISAMEKKSKADTALFYPAYESQNRLPRAAEDGYDYMDHKD